MRKILLAAIPFTYLLILLFQKDLAMLGDLGRHLKLGEIVLQCHCVPQTNLFSYTHPNFPIVNHEWLAEVILYLISKTFGLSGLLIFKMIVIITAATLLYRIALKKGSVYWVTIFSLLCITLFSLRFFVLPELFSYLFIAVFLFILEKYKTSKKISLLLLLPLLQVLWVNMHIYFILGISIYIFFTLENILQEKKLNRNLLLIGAALIFATLLNPSGIKGALLPFTFSHNYGFVVEENGNPFTILSPNSTNANIAYTLVLQIFVFEFLLGMFLIGLLLSKNQWKRLLHFGNGITGAFLAANYTRCVSLFGILGFIPLIQICTSLEEKLSKSVYEPMKNILKGALALGVFLVVGMHIKGVIDYKILWFGFEPSAEKAADFIKQTNLKGRIFNNYVVGNYLIYALYPKEHIYIDARPEAYPAPFFADYWRMMADEPFFNQQVKKYRINAVVFNVAFEDPIRSRPFLLRLLQNPDWVPVYGDGTVTIFVRNNEVNKAIINKYKIPIST